jgi:hypothetical protein
MHSNINQQFIQDHGFIVLDSLIPGPELDGPVALIETIILDTGIPGNKLEASAWVAKKSKIQNNKIMLSCINDESSYVRKELNKLFGKVKDVKSCQIASRFPGERAIIVNNERRVPEKWYAEWHIDNYTEKDFRRHHPPPEFTCLVGIYLTDNEQEFAGNYTVFPRAHHQIQAFSRKHGMEYYALNGLRDICLPLSEPYQIKAKKGSVVIAHRMLPHLISAPNITDTTRTIVWYRIKADQEQAQAQAQDQNVSSIYYNIWKEWSALKYEPMPVNEFTDDVNKIELEGLGYFTKFDHTLITLRIKPFNTFPAFFASHVTLQYNITTHDFSIHTNGFIEKHKHHDMHEIIKRDLGDTLTPYSIGKWINECDYEKLINRMVPFNGYWNTNHDSTTQCLKFHHLHSRSKSAMMVRWAHELKIDGMLIMGSPGHLVLRGDAKSLSLYMDRFNWLHWKKVEKCPIPDDALHHIQGFIKCHRDDDIVKTLKL